MRFSERLGFKSPRLELQKDGISQELRAGLWTALCTSVLRFSSILDGGHWFQIVSTQIFVRFFKRPIDEVPAGEDGFLQIVRRWFFAAEWYEVYDFIEFASRVGDDQYPEAASRVKQLENMANQFLEEEKSAYRLVGGSIAPITSEQEIGEVNAASGFAGKYKAIATHIGTALRLYSDRKSPDYRNSVKESISAVESAVKIITGDDKGTVANALNVIQKKHGLHPALKEALSRLYGYTSDQQGIRHAILEKPNVDEGDARFMLVICSAFVNFLVQKMGKDL